MNGLSEKILLAIAMIWLGVAIDIAHADLKAAPIKAQFHGWYTRYIGKEQWQTSKLGPIGALVIRSNYEFERFKEGIPPKEIGKYQEDRRPANSDPILKEKIDFNENLLVVVVSRSNQCGLAIERTYQDEDKLLVKLTEPHPCSALSQLDSSGEYHAVVVGAPGLKVEFLGEKTST